MPVDLWDQSVNGSLGQFQRIVRSTKQSLGIISLTPQSLAECSAERQAMIVESISPREAALVVHRASQNLRENMIWLVAGTTDDHVLIKREFNRFAPFGLTSAGDNFFKNPEVWPQVGIRTVLVSVDRLREGEDRERRWRAAAMAHGCPLMILYDSDLSTSSVPIGTNWDPAWAIRDFIARIAARYPAPPMLVLTHRSHMTLNPSGVQRAWGASGLIYLKYEATEAPKVQVTVPTVGQPAL